MKKVQHKSKTTFGNLSKPKTLQMQGGVKRTMAVPKVKKPKSVFGSLKVKKV